MNKLTLILNTEDQADDKKTAAFPRRRPRRLGRRRLPGGIRFFDLGYKLVSEGVYQTIAYQDPYRTDPLESGALPFFLDSEVKDLDLTRVQALTDLVYEVPIGQWTQQYAQYDGVYTDSTPWIDDWLRINWRGTGQYDLLTGVMEAVFANGKFTPPTEAVNNSFVLYWVNSVFGHQVFESNMDIKITNENDYAADAVTYVPSTSFDVFFMPMLCTIKGEMEYRVPDNPAIPLGSGTSHYYEMGYHYVVLPREINFDPTNDYYDLFGLTLNGSPTHSLSQTFNLSSMDSAEYAYLTRGFRFLQEYFPYFVKKYQFVSSTSTWSSTTIAAEDFYPNDYYPEYPAMPTVPAATVSASFGVEGRQYCVGQLLAVIKQAGIYYYIWSNEHRSSIP